MQTSAVAIKVSRPLDSSKYVQEDGRSHRRSPWNAKLIFLDAITIMDGCVRNVVPSSARGLALVVSGPDSDQVRAIMKGVQDLKIVS